MAPIFLTIGDVDGLFRQFLDFTIYMYIDEKKKPQIKKTIESKTFFTDAMRSMNINTYPKTLEELTELYLQEPITDQDRSEFLFSYMIPFMSTGKSVKELYSVNPEVMTPVLDALIQSKRIQRLISANQGDILNGIKRQFQQIKYYGIKTPEKQQEFLQDIDTVLSKYKKAYEDQEAVIASRWVEAVEKEPKFLASNVQYSDTVQSSKKGGSRYRRKTRKSRRKTRRTRK
jgi:hypothetical protein